MAGYAWRRDETPPPPKPTEPAPTSRPRGRPKGLKPFDPTQCGTMRGWRQHRAHGQKECRACMDAQNAVMKEYRARKKAESDAA